VKKGGLPKLWGGWRWWEMKKQRGNVSLDVVCQYTILILASLFYSSSISNYFIFLRTDSEMHGYVQSWPDGRGT
jgi:hypothetical protein